MLLGTHDTQHIPHTYHVKLLAKLEKFRGTHTQMRDEKVEVKETKHPKPSCMCLKNKHKRVIQSNHQEKTNKKKLYRDSDTRILRGKMVVGKKYRNQYENLTTSAQSHSSMSSMTEDCDTGIYEEGPRTQPKGQTKDNHGMTAPGGQKNK